jgi:hypothetical protein
MHNQKRNNRENFTQYTKFDPNLPENKQNLQQFKHGDQKGIGMYNPN